MRSTTFWRSLIVIPLGLYWVWPLAFLGHRKSASDREISRSASSVPAPVIERVLVVPSHDRHREWSYDGITPGFRRVPGQSDVMIVGRHFKPLDESHPRKQATVTIAGQTHTATSRDVTTEDYVIDLTVSDSDLPAHPDDSITVTVARDGKVSDTYRLTGVDVAQQLADLRQDPERILAVIPTGYPLTEHIHLSLGVRIIVSGWNDLTSISCPTLLTIDGERLSCHDYLCLRGPNVVEANVPLGAPGHEVSLALVGGRSSDYRFSTAEFERYGKERQALRHSYYRHRGAKDRALGLNLVLTLTAAHFFRPWRSAGVRPWALVLGIPVVLQATLGVVLGLFAQGGDFLAPIAGLALIVFALGGAVVPLIEVAVVASVAGYASGRLRHLAGDGSAGVEIGVP